MLSLDPEKMKGPECSPINCGACPFACGRRRAPAVRTTLSDSIRSVGVQVQERKNIGVNLFPKEVPFSGFTKEIKCQECGDGTKSLSCPKCGRGFN